MFSKPAFVTRILSFLKWHVIIIICSILLIIGIWIWFAKSMEKLEQQSIEVKHN